MTVRTRIAPSPTGDPHVGTAYVALFNKVFANSQGGQFILRIEDTDQARSTPESEQAILDALSWLDLTWDEGPDIGGPHGPYRQSERGEIYARYARQLLDDKHAFCCFCSPQRLSDLRQQQMTQQQPIGYDGHCQQLTAQQVATKQAAGEKHVVRMKVPRDGSCVFNDRLRGEIRIDWSQIDMQVLLKADGMPTYHLANVVDDHLMAISHVIRGEEWINSTPKHILLYQYFNWDSPEFIHLPLLRNPDKSKLSKRKNPTSILYYQRMGYLPEAMLNYLARMGWSMPDEREKFTLADMQAEFNIERMSLGGPIFDVEKLSWLNGLWIREGFTDVQLAEKLMDWALNKDRLLAFLPHARQRMETFSDLITLGGYLLNGKLSLTEEALCGAQERDQVIRIVQFSLWQLEALSSWQRDEILTALQSLAASMEIKFKLFLAPLFVAISGSSASISVMDSMVLLGPDMSKARLRHAIDVLGGAGKKKIKQLEKTYKALISASIDDPTNLS